MQPGEHGVLCAVEPGVVHRDPVGAIKVQRKVLADSELVGVVVSIAAATKSVVAAVGPSGTRSKDGPESGAAHFAPRQSAHASSGWPHESKAIHTRKPNKC